MAMRYLKCYLGLLACSPLALLVPPIAYAVPLYAVTPLGAGTYGTAVNNSGEVTGYYYPPGAPFQNAFLYDNGSLRNLGTLGGTLSFGYGLNSNGEVTGAADPPHIGIVDFGTQPALFSNGTVQALGCFGSTNNCGGAGYAINDNGQITGSANDHAFIYSNGSMQDLGTLTFSGPSALSVGYGINSSGEVAGEVGLADHGAYLAFLYSNGTMKPLPTLGGFSSAGYGINASGEVTGTSDTARNLSRAFLYADGSVKDLGSLSPVAPSVGLGINDSGEVVGWAGTYLGGPTQNAFLYSDGFMYNLNRLIGSEASLCTLDIAVAISDDGDIVADGPGGAYLLTPIPNTNLVSEPGTLGLLALGLTGLGLMLRYRSRII